jgi:hypothetical protein
MLRRVRTGSWPDSMTEPPGLVLDGLVWMRRRKSAVAMVVELLIARAKVGQRTSLCQSHADGGSIHALISGMPPGSLVVIGLRFPKGRRGRLRFAMRMCKDLDVQSSEARATVDLTPWTYARVIAYLRKQSGGIQ